MITPYLSTPTYRLALTATLLTALSIPAWSATRPFNAQKPAVSDGTVEIVNVAGSIEISGWDQSVVEVSGTIGARIERVDVTSGDNRTTIRVVLPSGNHWDSDDDAHLKIRVPQKSALDVSLVSADLHVSGVSGRAHLQTVSGAIIGEGVGSAQVDTVSGDVRLASHNAHDTQVKTVSGDLTLDGVDGEVRVTTVSGDAALTLGSLSRAQLETISGDMKVSGTLTADGQMNAESVSGDLQVEFAAQPEAEIDVQSFSGEIKNCFGPKPVEEKYGPGSRLNFRSGKATGRVHLETKSGDVEICDRK